MERMGTTWASFSERMRGFWEAQSQTTRIVAISAASVVGIALVRGAMYGLHRTDYGVLFSNLSPEDASAVTQKLKEEKVTYQLRMVALLSRSSDSIYERIALAGAGVSNT